MLKKSLFIGTFFLLFIGLSDYGYGCHTGTKHKTGALCGDDGGGGGGGGVVKPTVVQTTAQWGGLIDEPPIPDAFGLPTFRPCVAQTMSPNGANGSYDCELNPARTLTYNLGRGEQTLFGGDERFCGVFVDEEFFPGVFDSDFVLAPNFKHSYGWNGKCFESVCTIRISNWFHDVEEVDGTRGAHIIVLRAVASLGPSADKNPFVDFRMLDIVEINITFGDGSQDLAVCEYSPDLGNLIEGDVTFTSTPLP